MTQTTHDGSDQKPTDGVGQGDYVSVWDATVGARTQMGGDALKGARLTDSLQGQLPFPDDRLRFLVKAFNGEINGDVNMTNEVMYEQALQIMTELGIDPMTRKQYAQALYVTFENISQPGTQFVAFDNDTSMKVFESPSDTRLSLKIDMVDDVPGLFVTLADGKRHSVLSLAEGHKIRSRYEYLIEQARASAQEQMIKMPKGSAGPAEAVIGYARLGMDLLMAPASLDFGKGALDQAKEARKRLKRYGVEIAEVMRAVGEQMDPEGIRAFVSVMVELQRLESDKDAIFEMLTVLDPSQDKPAPSDNDGGMHEHLSGLEGALKDARLALGRATDAPQA